MATRWPGGQASVWGGSMSEGFEWAGCSVTGVVAYARRPVNPRSSVDNKSNQIKSNQ
jgi:hypothetical protein